MVLNMTWSSRTIVLLLLIHLIHESINASLDLFDSIAPDIEFVLKKKKENKVPTLLATSEMIQNTDTIKMIKDHHAYQISSSTMFVVRWFHF